jgi:hypothetical protein
MSRPSWHHFLLKYAQFPFPEPEEGTESTSAIDISQIEIGLLRREWRANRAVRDNTLIQKLCDALQNILGEAVLSENAEKFILANLLPRILVESVDEFDYQDEKWSCNSSEAEVSFLNGSRSLFRAKQFMLTLRQSRSLLITGVYEAARKCLAAYGGYSLNTKEDSIQGGSSVVVVVVTVDRTMIVLCEVKSPSVMKKVGELLPPRGIELKWTRGQSFIQNILSKVSMVFFCQLRCWF